MNNEDNGMSYFGKPVKSDNGKVIVCTDCSNPLVEGFKAEKNFKYWKCYEDKQAGTGCGKFWPEAKWLDEVLCAQPTEFKSATEVLANDPKRVAEAKRKRGEWEDDDKHGTWANTMDVRTLLRSPKGKEGAEESDTEVSSQHDKVAAVLGDIKKLMEALVNDQKQTAKECKDIKQSFNDVAKALRGMELRLGTIESHLKLDEPEEIEETPVDDQGA